MRLMIYCLFILLLVFITSAVGQEQSGQGNLTVIITGFDNDDGVVKIALNDTQEDYESDDQAYRSEEVTIKDKTAVWTFENIPFGDYSIKTYHDENNDNELDTNFLGMPTEAYGFSNDASGSFGPASWEDAMFLFKTDKDTIYISIE